MMYIKVDGETLSKAVEKTLDELGKTLGKLRQVPPVELKVGKINIQKHNNQEEIAEIEKMIRYCNDILSLPITEAFLTVKEAVALGVKRDDRS
jgi:hypothetical protein